MKASIGAEVDSRHSNSTQQVPSDAQQRGQEQPASQAAQSRPSLILPIFRLRGKLILPYVFLTLLLAVVGNYVITHLVASSIRERFMNQLYEASRVASDGVVRKERSHLEDLRLMVFSNGIAEAIQTADRQTLQEILLPLSMNSNLDVTTAVDLEGQEVLTLGWDSSENRYTVSQGADFSAVPFIIEVLSGEVDSRGDKFIGILDTTEGPALFTSAPIHDEQGRLAGAILVGSRLNSLSEDLKAQSLADLVLFDPQGELIANTLARSTPDLQELSQAVGQVRPDDLPPTGLIHLYGRSFQVVYSPLTVRDQTVGSIGVALSSSYMTSTQATSRDLFILVFALGTGLIIIVGTLLAQNIARPILRLRSLTQAVAAGDLNQSMGLERADEIGDLAQAFDQMTLQLRERTAETVRLYAEMVERNKELAVINARLQATQQQLIQSEKLAAVGQLTAGIVHDVKNPLAVIKGLAELLESEEDLSSREEITIIRHSAEKANQIVSDLLKFARQDTPQMMWQDLRETVDATLRLTTYLTRQAHVKVILDAPPQPVMANYDAQQIEQVLLNLVTNAIHAMPSGGTLRIHLSQAPEAVAIAVQDSGTGIPPEHLNRIFDPFFTTKPPGEGTGLGLSVSYGMVSCHHGEIKVESTVGQGTTFTVLLPVNSQGL